MMVSNHNEGDPRRPYQITLISLPFARMGLPSIGLTQLESVVKSRYRDRVSTTICYLQHEFGTYLGVDLYRKMDGAHTNGLGDWFFRDVAFPEVEDNSELYFRRHYPRRDAETRRFIDRILEKRRGLEDFMDGLITRYELDRARLVASTSMFSQNVACFALARKLKERDPNITTVMGGANCESPMGEEIVRNVSSIDFVFSGPALESFPEFVGYELQGDFEKRHAIHGVFSSRNLAAFRRDPTSDATTCDEGTASGLRTMGDELDINVRIDLDFESFLDSVETHFPGGEVDPMVLMETSRGCWWGERSHCTFCGLNGSTMKFRTKDPELAIEEFEALFKYFPRSRKISTVDLIMPMSYLTDVLPRLSPPPGMVIFYEIKANLKEEQVRTLARAQVNLVQPGIEALATSTLRLMKKGSTSFINLSLLKYCAMYAVFPAWNLLVGFPGEKETVYQKYLRDIPLLAHLPPPDGVHPIRFDRFSPYFHRADEYGLNLKPFDFYQLVYPFDRESLANLAYYFVDDNFDAEYQVGMVRWIGEIRALIEEWKARWPRDSPQDRAELHLETTKAGTRVHDSRSGRVHKFQISDLGRRILDLLAGKWSLPVAKLDDITDCDTRDEVAFLEDRGLVFEEDGSIMSLVLPNRPSVSMVVPPYR